MFSFEKRELLEPKIVFVAKADTLFRNLASEPGAVEFMRLFIISPNWSGAIDNGGVWLSVNEFEFVPDSIWFYSLQKMENCFDQTSLCGQLVDYLGPKLTYLQIKLQLLFSINILLHSDFLISKITSLN